MPNITYLNSKIRPILDAFFIDIEKFTLSDFNQQHQFLERTKKLFSDLTNG